MARCTQGVATPQPNDGRSCVFESGLAYWDSSDRGRLVLAPRESGSLADLRPARNLPAEDSLSLSLRSDRHVGVDGAAGRREGHRGAYPPDAIGRRGRCTWGLRTAADGSAFHLGAGRRILIAAKGALPYIAVVALCVPLGTIWHELVGHGLTGILAGGRIIYVQVLGVTFWPRVAWTGWPTRFGTCGVEGIQTLTGWYLHMLAGSLSTWLVAAVASVALWARRWRGTPRLALIGLSIWWLDLFTYTLPSWGLPRFILWYRVPSEPYKAAVGMGIPGRVFQAFAVASSFCMLTSLVVWLVRERKHERCKTASEADFRRAEPR